MTPEKRLNNLVWFELPVNDLDRAASFYESILPPSSSAAPTFPISPSFPASKPRPRRGP